MTPFEEHLAFYLGELRLNRYSDSLQEQARRILPRFFRHLEEASVHDIRAAQEEHLASFARRLASEKTAKGAPLSLGSQVVYLSALRRFFAFLDKRGFILTNPAKTLPLPRALTLPRGILSVKEARRLVSAPSAWTAIGQRDRALLETLYGAGLRLAECARADLGDLDLSGATLLVRNGKGRRDRVVPLPCHAARALDVYLRGARPDFVRDPKEQALFLSVRGQRLKRVSVYAIVRGHGRAIGVKVAPHGLRHACATHLLRGGAGVRHIQELLGHAHLDTTLVYTRVEPSDLRELLDRVHPRSLTRRPRRSRQ